MVLVFLSVCLVMMSEYCWSVVGVWMCRSVDAKCRGFVAQVKRLVKTTPAAEYETVSPHAKMVDLFSSKDKNIFKLVALSPTEISKTESSDSTTEPVRTD